MNRLRGTISAVESAGHVRLVDVNVNGVTFSAILLESEIAPSRALGPADVQDAQMPRRPGMAESGLDPIGEAAERLHPGAAVTLAFKETEVSLAKNLSGLISLRNRLPARVRAVEKGRVLAKVTLDYQGLDVVSIITTRSAERLDIQIGDLVEALVKANEMTILHDEDTE